MMSFIPLLQLTKSVQDAIHTTRQLKLRYLWVDYLCIIQDSITDWNQEAAVMNKVYSHSACTIAAAAASNGTNGLFFQRNPYLVTPKTIRFSMNQEENDYFALDDDLWKDEIQSAPLNKRAWVLQEMILSPRILYFAEHQIFWSCSENQSCESFPSQFPKDCMSIIDKYGPGLYATISSEICYMKKAQLAVDSMQPSTFESMMHDDTPYVVDLPQDIVLDESCEGMTYGSTASLKSKCIPRRRLYSDVFQESWKRIVEDYSSRLLTRVEDKAMAIQGLANEMKRYIDSSYISGHWYRNLPLELLWQPSGRKHSCLADRFRAPSWSWLAADGPVVMPVSDFGIPAPKVEILKDSIDPEDTAPGVDSQHRFLRIRGRLARAFIENSDAGSSQFHHTIFYEKARGKDVAEENLGFEVACDLPPRLGITEVFIVQLVGYGKFYDRDTVCAAGLVLEKGRNKAEFTRYGSFELRDGFGLFKMVRGFDMFDQSDFSKNFAHERRGCANVYEIVLV
jgi:hypothetical protein